MAFEIGSTNLVVELGIILALLMGRQFTAAEFVGGAWGPEQWWRALFFTGHPVTSAIWGPPSCCSRRPWSCGSRARAASACRG